MNVFTLMMLTAAGGFALYDFVRTRFISPLSNLFARNQSPTTLEPACLNRYIMQALLLPYESPISAHTIVLPLLPESPSPAGLWLPFPNGRRFVPAEQILALAGERNYTHIHFTNGRRLLYSKTLGHLLDLLPALAFARIHRSHAVNRQHIHTIDSSKAELVDGTEWAVSRRKGRVTRRGTKRRKA